MSDNVKYGKSVYEVTKNDIIKHFKIEKKSSTIVFISVSLFMFYCGFTCLFGGDLDIWRCALSITIFVVAILLLIMWPLDAKRQRKLNYNDFHACVYENGFIIKNDKNKKINIDLSFDEIKKIKRKFSGRHHVYIIIDKKSGNRLQFDYMLFSDYMNVDVFYSNLKRAFNDYKRRK